MTNHRLVKSTSDVVTYVLRLADGNFYIGTTTQLAKRLKSHFSGKGARWTQRHKPEHLVGVADGDHEEYLTKRCRSLYGKDRVRGWIYTVVASPDMTFGLNFKRPSGEPCQV